MSHHLIATPSKQSEHSYADWDKIAELQWCSDTYSEIYTLLGFKDKDRGCSGDGSEVELPPKTFIDALAHTKDTTEPEIKTFLQACINSQRSIFIYFR